MKRKTLLTPVLVAVLAAAMLAIPSCSKPSQDDGVVDIAYVAWKDAIATAHVAQVVLEKKMHKKVKLHQVAAATMWQAVAKGSYDAFLAGWLPVTHAKYWKRYKNQVVDLGPNLTGAKTGLVVPDYVNLSTIPDLKGKADMFGGIITGIDPGAGIMQKTKDAIKAYGLSGYKLQATNGATMTEQLGRAIDAHKPIVVTGWNPHWMFGKWKLKYLKDPKNIYGQGEKIHTIVRQGLKKDMPEAYAFLNRFHWSLDDVQQVMAMNRKPDAKPAKTAAKWVKDHPDKVNAWLPKKTAAAPAPAADKRDQGG